MSHLVGLRVPLWMVLAVVVEGEVSNSQVDETVV